MKPFQFGLIVPLLLTAALAFAACGGDDDDAGSDDAATTAPAATAGGGGPNVIQVEAADFSFDPPEIEATAGDPITVEVNNTGSAPHTLTVYRDEEYTEPVDGADTGNISGGAGGEFTTKFDDPGQYFFRCDLHPTQMEGELTVQ